MLSVLPELLFLAPLAAFVIRVALALTLGWSAWRHFSAGAMAITVAEAVPAVLILIGLWTQLAAIIAALAIFAWLFMPTMRIFPRSTALLSLVMALSLIVTGAGAFAFDLPL